MIARVRIAKIEHWCKEAQSASREDPERWGNNEDVGMIAEIFTESMGTDTQCRGRNWKLTDKSADELIARTGANIGRWEYPVWLCEHMLELD